MYTDLVVNLAVYTVPSYHLLSTKVSNKKK
ncbi:hypothetical protein PITC_011040 [Penicillium italicum]|uniref:Uncharacterized protein n=1 Tax=Penicillium italicum TaxID=40296 RepID=A0A0A2L7U7_PENIT|nr:hypothetical protein PITC_011040 [Penicillium italicum]